MAARIIRISGACALPDRVDTDPAIGHYRVGPVGEAVQPARSSARAVFPLLAIERLNLPSKYPAAVCTGSMSPSKDAVADSAGSTSWLASTSNAKASA